MKRLVHACLLILALASVGLAQNDARELWLARAQNITSDLLKDSSDLSSTQRAVLWVKLAQRWWREDPKRARTWIAKAIEVVEQVPNKEGTEERRERLETAQILLTIITPLDQKLADRLLTVLGPDKSTEDVSSGTASALVEAATTILKDDPKRAAELAALALRIGRPLNLDPLLYGLRVRDPNVADALFVQALALAKSQPGGMFTNMLTYIAFPAQRGRSGDLPVPPDNLKTELLRILMTFVTANLSNGEAENSNCGAVAWLAPLYGEFERLLPKQWLTLRQAINECQSSSPQIRERINYNRDQRLNTVESFLSAAADAKDVESRTNYKYLAADLAQEHKDYDRALKILNDMSDEERKLMGESWTSAEWDWAADGAVEHYRNSRFGEMNLLLDRVPSDLQPLAKVAFIYRLGEQSISETAPILPILDDAIKGLRRSNIPVELKSEWYLAILRSVIKYQPADATQVLKDAIASLNQLKQGQPLDAFEPYGTLGDPLFEMDEFVVKDALASLTSVQTRTHIRLALLKVTLQHLKPVTRN
jgi:hypothetical protein